MFVCVVFWAFLILWGCVVVVVFGLVVLFLLVVWFSFVWGASSAKLLFRVVWCFGLAFGLVCCVNASFC